jgi:L,D-transpeptidase ErfK/SrfK
MRQRWALVSWVAVIGLVASARPSGAQTELQRVLARLPPVFGEAELYPRNGTEEISDIARRFGVSASAVFNANGGELALGDELLLIPTAHVAPVPFQDGVLVNLAERNLYLYEQGRPVRVFPVAIGQRGWETPTGGYTIANKAKNPTWFPPSWALEEEPVPPGPDNPLGDRWMGLSIKGYGVHATNSPSSVGLYVSHGCMRMYPEHAHALYDKVAVGMPVEIIYRRVVFGFDSEEGVVCMAYHPDPYFVGTIRPEYVREALQTYGLDKVVDMEAVVQALERPTSIPTPIAGSSAKLLVNGKTVPLALGPTRAGRDWLVAAGPLAKALWAELELGPRRDYLLMRRGSERLFYSMDCAEALVNGRMVNLRAAPQLAAGHPLIPLKDTVTLLGGSVGWDEARQAILVWDGWGMASFPRTSPSDMQASTEARSFFWHLLTTGLERITEETR